MRQSGEVNRHRIERLGRLTKSKIQLEVPTNSKNHEKHNPKNLQSLFIEQQSGTQKSDSRSNKPASQYAKDLLGSESSGRGYGQDGERRDDNLSQNLGHTQCRSEEGAVNL